MASKPEVMSPEDHAVNKHRIAVGLLALSTGAAAITACNPVSGVHAAQRELSGVGNFLGAGSCITWHAMEAGPTLTNRKTWLHWLASMADCGGSGGGGKKPEATIASLDTMSTFAGYLSSRGFQVVHIGYNPDNLATAYASDDWDTPAGKDELDIYLDSVTKITSGRYKGDYRINYSLTLDESATKGQDPHAGVPDVVFAKNADAAAVAAVLDNGHIIEP